MVVSANHLFGWNNSATLNDSNRPVYDNISGQFFIRRDHNVSSTQRINYLNNGSRNVMTLTSFSPSSSWHIGGRRGDGHAFTGKMFEFMIIAGSDETGPILQLEETMRHRYIYLGMTSSFAADNATQIIQQASYQLPNDLYWIKVPTLGPRQLYCIMETAAEGGGWMSVTSEISPVTSQSISSASWISNTSSYLLEPLNPSVLNVNVIGSDCGVNSTYTIRSPSEIGFNYTQSMLLMRRVNTIGQCSSINSESTRGYYTTTNYKGIRTTHPTCLWGDGVWANACCNSQNMTNLRTHWFFRGSATNPSLIYASICGSGGNGTHYHMWFIK